MLKLCRFPLLAVMFNDVEERKQLVINVLDGLRQSVLNISCDE